MTGPENPSPEPQQEDGFEINPADQQQVAIANQQLEYGQPAQKNPDLLARDAIEPGRLQDKLEGISGELGNNIDSNLTSAKERRENAKRLNQEADSDCVQLIELVGGYDNLTPAEKEACN